MNIAFVGPQGSGKSTLAAMLEQRRVHPYTVLPIAEAIRTVAALSYGDDFDKGKQYSQRRMGLDWMSKSPAARSSKTLAVSCATSTNRSGSRRGTPST